MKKKIHEPTKSTTCRWLNIQILTEWRSSSSRQFTGTVAFKDCLCLRRWTTQQYKCVLPKITFFSLVWKDKISWSVKPDLTSAVKHYYSGTKHGIIGYQANQAKTITRSLGRVCALRKPFMQWNNVEVSSQFEIMESTQVRRICFSTNCALWTIHPVNMGSKAMSTSDMSLIFCHWQENVASLNG